MPHVSRHVPEKKITDKIYAELLEHITARGSEKDRSTLCSDLLTPTERIMLAKRLAIICMLGEGYPFEDIQEVLRVSPSTIGRLWSAIQKGKYVRITQIVRKRKLSDSILGLLEKLLSIPRPRHGPRWAFIDDIKYKD
jgi:uncharacterized protein YerC